MKNEDGERRGEQKKTGKRESRQRMLTGNASVQFIYGITNSTAHPTSRLSQQRGNISPSPPHHSLVFEGTQPWSCSQRPNEAANTEYQGGQSAPKQSINAWRWAQSLLLWFVMDSSRYYFGYRHHDHNASIVSAGLLHANADGLSLKPFRVTEWGQLRYFLHWTHISNIYFVFFAHLSYLHSINQYGKASRNQNRT